MKKKFILLLIFVIVALVLWYAQKGQDAITISVKTNKGTTINFSIPMVYSNNPNDQDDDVNMVISAGELGKEDYKRIDIYDESYRNFSSIGDYKKRYVDEEYIFNRCSSDSAGVSNYCTKVLDTKIIRDDNIKVFKYELERVREVYLNDENEPQRKITTHTTYDVILPSYELITIYPDQSLNDKAVNDAEFIAKNIEVEK